MRRMQLKVRSLMAVVALAALALSLTTFAARSARYRELAWHHHQVMVNLKMGPARARYHSALFEKYRAAARRPWLAVPADPSPPPCWGEAPRLAPQRTRPAAEGDWYDLAVWSSAGGPYVAGLVGGLFPDGSSLRFVWSCERCTRRLHPETRDYYWVKDLKKVKRAGFALGRVLMIDDTPAKLERNYGNHLRVHPFEGRPEDTELRDVPPFLDRLRAVEDMRAVEKRHWRRLAGAADA